MGYCTLVLVCVIKPPVIPCGAISKERSHVSSFALLSNPSDQYRNIVCIECMERSPLGPEQRRGQTVVIRNLTDVDRLRNCLANWEY